MKKLVTIIGSLFASFMTVCLLLILSVTIILFTPKKVGKYFIFNEEKVDKATVSILIFNEEQMDSEYIEIELTNCEDLIVELLEIRVKPKLFICKCKETPSCDIVFEIDGKNYRIGTEYTEGTIIPLSYYYEIEFFNVVIKYLEENNIDYQYFEN